MHETQMEVLNVAVDQVIIKSSKAKNRFLALIRLIPSPTMSAAPVGRLILLSILTYDPSEGQK
ncbi:hypothetical protein BH09BAC3_BH09BAC3_08110 [soil metagenome]